MSLRSKLAFTISLTTLGIMLLLSVGIIALVDHQFSLMAGSTLETNTQTIQSRDALHNLLWSLLVADLLAAILAWFLSWFSVKLVFFIKRFSCFKINDHLSPLNGK